MQIKETRKDTHEAPYSVYHPIKSNLKGIKMNITKASYVKHEYSVPAALHCSSEVCYTLAVAAAHRVHGIEITNSNDGQRTISFATRTFVFDDSSIAQITYGGVWCINA